MPKLPICSCRICGKDHMTPIHPNRFPVCWKCRVKLARQYNDGRKWDKNKKCFVLHLGDIK